MGTPQVRAEETTTYTIEVTDTSYPTPKTKTTMCPQETIAIVVRPYKSDGLNDVTRKFTIFLDGVKINTGTLASSNPAAYRQVYKPSLPLALGSHTFRYTLEHHRFILGWKLTSSGEVTIQVTEECHADN
jgi:hypothetical protein